MNAISIFSSFIKKSKYDKPYNSDVMIKNFFIKNIKIFLSSRKLFPYQKSKIGFVRKKIFHIKTENIFQLLAQRYQLTKEKLDNGANHY